MLMIKKNTEAGSVGYMNHDFKLQSTDSRQTPDSKPEEPLLGNVDPLS